LSASDPAFEGHLIYEVDGDVAVITYDRPERRNAMNVPMYRALTAAVEKANADDAVGAMVFTHTGPVFCAGTDLKATPEPKDPVTGVRPSVATLGMADDTSWIHLMQRSKPSVVALNGLAVGLGVTHILACDLRIGSPLAVLSFPFLAVGTMPEYGFSALLPRMVGFAAAMEICLTSAKLDAQQALAKGLLSRIVPEEALRTEAVALASTLARLPAMQTRLTRQLLHANAAEPDLNTVLTRERDAFVTLFRAQRAAAKAQAEAVAAKG
jgi:enoyl-CoA hydratase/carnithine racemase